MTSKLTGHERVLVAAFTVLSVATSIALLSDLEVLSWKPEEAVLSDVIGLVLRLLVG